MITRDFNEVFNKADTEEEERERKRSVKISMDEFAMSDISNSIDTEEEEFEDGKFKKPAFNVRRPWNTFITIDQVSFNLIFKALDYSGDNSTYSKRCLYLLMIAW